MGIIIPKLRQSARGQPCTFNTPWCEPNNETVCLCHLPSDIKGMGNKSDDWHAAFGCHACHLAIDQHRLAKDFEMFYCLRALQRTHKIWRDMGLIVIAGDTEKPRKPSTKTIQRSPLYVQGD